MADDFITFANLVSKWDGAYVSSCQSYLGYKTKECVQLLIGKIILESLPLLEEPATFKFETEQLVAGRLAKRINAGDLAQILARAKEGKMEGLHGSMSFPPESGRVSNYWSTGDDAFPSTMFIRGESNYSLQTLPWREMNWGLRAADPPFESVDDLLGYCGLAKLKNDSNYPRLEIIASAAAVIDEKVSLSKGHVGVVLRAGQALDRNKVTLRCWSYDANRIRRNVKIANTSFTWQEGIGTNCCHLSIPVGDAAEVELFLSYDGIPLSRKVIVDPKQTNNLRSCIHAVFDHNAELLKGWLLNPEKNEADEFEYAVATLFYLLGFATNHYGLVPKLQDGPDIIASTQGNQVLIIECTLGLLNNKEKLAKLVQRTKVVRSHLPQSDKDKYELLPMMVTTLSREQIAANIDAAGEHRIAVLCREELEELLRQTAAHGTPEQIFEWAKTNVPLAKNLFHF